MNSLHDVGGGSAHLKCIRRLQSGEQPVEEYRPANHLTEGPRWGM